MSWRKIRALALSEVSDDRSFVIVRPAIEKTLSDGAEVAGIHKTYLAKLLNRGKVFSFFFHQISGLFNTLAPSTLQS